jgi:hypothetical protein
MEAHGEKLEDKIRKIFNPYVNKTVQELMDEGLIDQSEGISTYNNIIAFLKTLVGFAPVTRNSTDFHRAFNKTALGIIRETASKINKNGKPTQVSHITTNLASLGIDEKTIAQFKERQGVVSTATPRTPRARAATTERSKEDQKFHVKLCHHPSIATDQNKCTEFEPACKWNVKTNKCAVGSTHNARQHADRIHKNIDKIGQYANAADLAKAFVETEIDSLFGSSSKRGSQSPSKSKQSQLVQRAQRAQQADKDQQAASSRRSSRSQQAQDDDF